MTPNEHNTAFLDHLFTKYGTDKGIWGYTPFYANLMGPARFHVRRVLEVGICGYRDIPNNVVGASLFVWREFFPNAEIYGLDNDSQFIFNDQERIHTAQVDAYNTDALHRALVGFGGQQFDVIIDDAVHDPDPQVKLMSALQPWLLRGGHYFMEDVCPYKCEGGDVNHLIERVRGYDTIVAGKPGPKPEVLIIGVN